ncbi:MAG: ABC-F family ATP-binding cassette domain-containing protein [Deltaproteobacteria bacterium]|nr:ABC-F family ATP-binding cassette domain-containing protein [Deltaproteobacteria bacterium]
MTRTPPRVALRGVCFTHVGRAATAVFDDLDLDLEPGWTGLVGPNGAGKTTLLRLLSGELRPDAGLIRFEPPAARVVRLVQVLDAPDDPLRAFATADDRGAVRLRAELGLDPEALARWATLSPGERRRWQIAAAVHAEPDVLLLDEPEGHLDVAGRALLVKALSHFDGVGVLVAHDRALLDRVTTTTVRIEGGVATRFPGPWSEASRAWEAERAARLHDREVLRASLDRARASLDATRREATAADGQRSARRRMKDKNDSDGRSVLAKNLAEWGARGHERGVRRQAGVVRQLERELDLTRVERRRDPRALAFVHVPAPSALLMGGHWPALTAGERVLARDVRVWLERDARVHLRGDNGAGKTTLVRALLETLRIPSALVLHLPQELPPEATASLLAELRAAPPDVRGRALALVATLGADPDRLLATAAPSPGEARKLHLALGLARGVSALVLDEPTNHLDLPSIERLQDALAAWPGSLLLVTHDAALAAAVTDTTWTLAGGSIAVEAHPPSSEALLRATKL